MQNLRGKDNKFEAFFFSNLISLTSYKPKMKRLMSITNYCEEIKKTKTDNLSLTRFKSKTHFTAF